MKTNIKLIGDILRIKKCERTIIQQAILDDWLYKWIGAPLRVICFPVKFIVKLYNWTYTD